MGLKKRLKGTAVVYHAWRSDQDTEIHTPDGSCVFYLERPLTAGRLDAEWNYRLQLGNKDDAPHIMTIRRQNTKIDGVACQIIVIEGADGQVVTCLKWYGDAKKRMNGRASGTKKYTFDWAGRELCWDSRTAFSGTDHFCTDTGSGEVLCYFRSVFWPLRKDGKVEISHKVRDEVTRTVLLASCMAYREWADKRETGVYVK